MSQFPPTEGPDGANNNSGADQAGTQGYPDTSGATNHGPQSAPLNGPDGNQQYGDETLPMDPSAVRQAALWILQPCGRQPSITATTPGT